MTSYDKKQTLGEKKKGYETVGGIRHLTLGVMFTNCRLQSYIVNILFIYLI